MVLRDTCRRPTEWGRTATDGRAGSRERDWERTLRDTELVLVDFDVDANFVLQGPEQGMIFKGMTFTPTLNEKGRSHQGEG